MLLIVLLIAIFAVSILLAYYELTCTYNAYPNGTESIVTFSTQENTPVIYAEVADTPQEHSLGLMHRQSLDPEKGMIFIFSSDSPRSFWMKNTLIPLDIIFVNSSLDIVKIHRDVPPCKANPCPTYRSGLPARYVVETNAGFSSENEITEGQKISFVIL